MKKNILDEILENNEKLSKIKRKNDNETKKDFRNDGLMVFLFCYMIGLLFIGIFMAIASEKLTIEIKIIISLFTALTIIIGGVIICIKRKVTFYKSGKIAEILKDKSEVEFLTLKDEALHNAKKNLSMKSEMKIIHQLSNDYDIKEKPFNMENLEERISYAEEEVSKKEEDLKTITYKYMLSDASYNIRSKKDLAFYFIMHSIFVYMAGYIFLALPMIMTKDTSGNAPFVWIPLLIPLVPTVIFIVIKFWITKEDIKAFYILNDSELPKKTDYCEYHQLKINMEDTQKMYQNYVEIAYNFFEKIERANKKENSV